MFVVVFVYVVVVGGGFVVGGDVWSGFVVLFFVVGLVVGGE